MKALQRFFNTAPVIFPLLALFLIALTIYEMSLFWVGSQHNSLFYLRPVIFLLFTSFWFGVCYLKKWAAISFIALTSIIICIYHLSPNVNWKETIGEILYKPLPLNILMCMFALLYYKKLK